jgi:outer membrane lipopolysaccharide assembly protein LptE/RlpB
MMRKTMICLAAVLALALLAGCGEAERGEVPPPPKTYTEEEIAAMPPQAQQRIRQQQQYSEKMSEANKSRAEAGR